ncbi:MAG: nitroreductase family protein [Tenericutes bacterium]|nr:nitroreductase family protein [Mycoplasmatota bacterium]
MKFLEALMNRRSIRDLTNKIGISDEDLIDIFKFNLKHTPSAFNSQSPKLLLLLDKEHHKFWDILKEELKKIVPKENFGKTDKKINGFRNGYGTVLFFDDSSITEDLIDKFPLYRENLLTWTEQHNGMLQANVWTSLAEHDIGASLQHYSEVVVHRLAEAFSVPKTCRLIAQMPFGGIVTEVGPKTFIDIDKRIIVMK